MRNGLPRGPGQGPGGRHTRALQRVQQCFLGKRGWCGAWRSDRTRGRCATSASGAPTSSGTAASDGAAPCDGSPGRAAIAHRPTRYAVCAAPVDRASARRGAGATGIAGSNGPSRA